MKVVAQTLVIFLSSWSGLALTMQNSCTHPNLLLDKRGKPVLLTWKETKKRITHCEAAKLPGTFDGKGIIQVKVLIDPEGMPQCVTALSGHPVMKDFATKAVLKWRFKPVEKVGKSVAAFGIVSVRVSWDSSYSKDSCDK